MVDNNDSQLRIPFAEGHEYSWVKAANCDDFVIHPDYKTTWNSRGKQLAASLEIIMQIVDECLSYTEVRKDLYLHGMPDDYPEKPIPNLGLFFIQYLDYKYGNKTDATIYATIISSRICAEHWTGIDDPECQAFLDELIVSGKAI